MFNKLLSGFIALYAYACLRMWQRVFGILSILPWWVYVFVCLLSVSIFLIGRLWLSIPPEVGRAFQIWSGYWLAFAFYFILITLMFDTVALINVLLGIVVITHRISLISGYAILASTCIIVMVGAWNARNLKVKKYSIDIFKELGKQRTYNIVMVSDIHLGDMFDLADIHQLVAKINTLSPDLVIIAGDIIDNPYTALALYQEADIKEAFGDLQSRYGIYAVLGNHDSFEEGEITRSFFTNTKVRILRDESVVVDESLVVIGRQDACIRGRKSINEMMSDNDLPCIVIDHRPILLDQSREAGASLLLCGHTHAGQLFPFNIVAKALFEVHYGYERRGNMHIVVSSGYGACMLPVRLGSRSEIVQIHLSI